VSRWPLPWPHCRNNRQPPFSGSGCLFFAAERLSSRSLNSGKTGEMEREPGESATALEELARAIAQVAETAESPN
jgi:hypothetical protein